MKILVLESQFNNIIKEIEYISKDELLKKGEDDKLEINLFGIYTINDMTKFYSLPPFKILKRYKTLGQNFADSSIEAGWKRVTENYPVVVVDIPIFTSKQREFRAPFYKAAKEKEVFSHSDNNIYVIFVNRGEGWHADKFWLRKSNNDAYKVFKKYLIGKDPINFIENLIKISYYKIHNPKENYEKLNSILSNVNPTNPDDLFFTDDDINREFYKPIAVTLRNGQNPQPIVDKIIKKYGRLSKHIDNLLKSDVQVLKKPRPNPYL